jgi:hypothetical protein
MQNLLSMSPITPSSKTLLSLLSEIMQSQPIIDSTKNLNLILIPLYKTLEPLTSQMYELAALTERGLVIS